MSRCARRLVGDWASGDIAIGPAMSRYRDMDFPATISRYRDNDYTPGILHPLRKILNETAQIVFTALVT
jgi:hypothetical protein